MASNRRVGLEQAEGAAVHTCESRSGNKHVVVEFTVDLLERFGLCHFSGLADWLKYGLRHRDQVVNSAMTNQVHRPDIQSVVLADPPRGDAPWVIGGIECLIDRLHLGKDGSSSHVKLKRWI